MTLRTAQPCGCTQESVLGAKRPKVCEHGNLFEKERPAGAKQPHRQSMKRSEPKRDWVDASAKVELEARCRVCGYEGPGIERAHVMGRKYDQPAHSGTRTLYVNPLDIVPLCPAWVPGGSCHQRFDAHELDLLPYLAPEEQTRAVEVAGGIEAARKRLAPSTFNAEMRELAA